MFKLNKITAITSTAALTLGIAITGFSMVAASADTGVLNNAFCVKAKNTVHGQVGKAGNCAAINGEGEEEVKAVGFTDFVLSTKLSLNLNFQNIDVVTWADGKYYYYDPQTSTYPNGHPDEFIMTSSNLGSQRFACSPEIDSCLLRVSYYEDGQLIATDSVVDPIVSGRFFMASEPAFEPDTYLDLYENSFDHLMTDEEVARVLTKHNYPTGLVTAEAEFVAVKDGIERVFGTWSTNLKEQRPNENLLQGTIERDGKPGRYIYRDARLAGTAA